MALLGKTVLFNGKFVRGEQDRLHGMAEAQSGTVVTELDSSVNYLVLPDLSQGKTIQKKLASLNAKGAAIQLIDRADFLKIVQPSPDQLLQLIRGGTANAAVMHKAIGMSTPVGFGRPSQGGISFAAESFKGLDLSGFNFSEIAFDHCSFNSCKIDETIFASAVDCDFSQSFGANSRFFRCAKNRFVSACLAKPSFNGSIADSDFTSADLTDANFDHDHWARIHSAISGTRAKPASVSAVFASAILIRSNFNAALFKTVDFDQADLTQSNFRNCIFESSSFRKAKCSDAIFSDCQLPAADFTAAVLQQASFSGSDLTNAVIRDADLKDINLLGAKLGNVDFAKAQNYNPNAISLAATGPALTELDTVCGTARRVCITFRIKMAKDDLIHQIGVDSRGLRWGGALRLPAELIRRGHRHNRGSTMSLAMKHLASIVPGASVQFGSIEVSSTKSPKVGKSLRDLVTSAVSEAFNQPVPAADELVAAIKTFRDEQKEQNSADKERRQKATKLAEKQKISAKRLINKKIEKQVGKVTDIATFLKALELRADKSKIDKATKMLKAEKFQLFNDITDAHLNGVVKSQTDADLVYACRIESSGQYACCTQNLNICGGLRGSICKHLLVLIIGLVKAGQLDPSSIDAWIAKSHDAKPELNKETMGEIFIRYKGAEAGEVDWRPTETVPEDYYAV